MYVEHKKLPARVKKMPIREAEKWARANGYILRYDSQSCETVAVRKH